MAAAARGLTLAAWPELERVAHADRHGRNFLCGGRPAPGKLSEAVRSQGSESVTARGSWPDGAGIRPTLSPQSPKKSPRIYLFGCEANGTFLPNSFRIASIFAYFSSAGIPGCKPACRTAPSGATIAIYGIP